MTQKFLKNSWNEMVQYLKEFSEWDKELEQIFLLCQVISSERKMTIEDSLFIIMYGDADIKDKSLYRRLN